VHGFEKKDTANNDSVNLKLYAKFQRIVLDYCYRAGTAGESASFHPISQKK
jgi:hypothetical protein